MGQSENIYVLMETQDNHHLTWILSAETSWILWVCPSILIIKAPPPAVFTSVSSETAKEQIHILFINPEKPSN